MHRPHLGGTWILVLCLAAILAVSLAGCSKSGGSQEPSGTAGDTRQGYGMGGVKQDVIVTKAALDDRPAAWVLKTPESTVRSYLDWISYAYRIGQSDLASATMSPKQMVRVDAYTQYNLQKEQLIQQKLDSLTLGKPVIKGSKAIVPAQETWSYRYVSLKEAGKVLSGPFQASYDSTYTLVNGPKGGWIVDSVQVAPKGEVK